jgi:hypothetical protein
LSHKKRNQNNTIHHYHCHKKKKMFNILQKWLEQNKVLTSLWRGKHHTIMATKSARAFAKSIGCVKKPHHYRPGTVAL